MVTNEMAYLHKVGMKHRLPTRDRDMRHFVRNSLFDKIKDHFFGQERPFVLTYQTKLAVINATMRKPEGDFVDTPETYEF